MTKKLKNLENKQSLDINIDANGPVEDFSTTLDLERNRVELDR